jgi:hypothetical protein
MAKKLQLKVPTPCHENWDNMTKTEKGRFCASCQKQVIDFSNKSDREIAMFFKKPSTGSVCGRFMEDQLNRDIAIPKKRIPWLKYFFQFLIPAFFISYRVAAQGKVKVVSNVISQPSKLSKAGQKQDKQTTKKPAQMVLPELKLTTITEPLFVDLGLDSNMINLVPVSQALTGHLGGVVIVAGGITAKRCYSKRASKSIPLFRRIFNDPAFSTFRIYPNPIKANSTLTIELNQKQSGDHLLQLFNQSGQLILSKDIYIDEKARSFTMNMPSIVPGNYFLRLTSKATGRSYTEKLIVE